MSKNTGSSVGAGVAQAAAVRDILGPAVQDGRISKDHKKLIHEVRDFIRNNASPDATVDYKAWEDLDILQVLQERAEPRMNAIAAALHILESGEKPEPWQQASSTHREASGQSKRGGNARGGRGGRRQDRSAADQRRNLSPSNGQQRRDVRSGSPAAAANRGRGTGSRGGRGAHATSPQATHTPSASSGPVRASVSAHTASEPQSSADSSTKRQSSPAPAPAPTTSVATPVAATASKKPMNFAAAARSGTQANTTVATATPTPAAGIASETQTAASTSSKSKPAKRVAKKSAASQRPEDATKAAQSPSESPSAPTVAASSSSTSTPAVHAASGWKPKRQAEPVVVEPASIDDGAQAKVRLPANLAGGSSSGIKFGGPRAASNSGSASTNPSPAAAVVADGTTHVASVAAPTQPNPPAPPAEMSALPMQMPVHPQLMYYYNYMQPGLQGPQAPPMMQPDYGIASAALYGAGHQQPMIVDQPTGQPAFTVNGLGLGSYPTQPPPYGAYGAIPPTNIPSQYAQMGMLPPMGMGLPLNMLPQTHPAAMQYSSMGQHSSIPPGYLQGSVPHGPSSGNQAADAMHAGGHQDSLHHANGMPSASLPFANAPGASSQDQHPMMMHPYAQMMPYPLPAHMQHGSVDLFPPGASPNGSSLFDQQQQQQQQQHQQQQQQLRQAKTGQPPQAAPQSAGQPAQVTSQVGVPAYARSYVGAAQTTPKQGPTNANTYPWGLQPGSVKSNQ